MMGNANALFAHHALLPSGWHTNVLLEWDPSGVLSRVQTNAPSSSGISIAPGPLLPGMPNLHSHAFQRAFAGLTEHRGKGSEQDSFWSWREQMYRFALKIGPEALRAIATALYVEMLEAGYTSVCEFHYLHHQPSGTPYADDTALSRCLIEAASLAGIGLTLLPVLYQTSGFGAQPPQSNQRRFVRQTDNMLRLLQTLLPVCTQHGARLGLAPHSLRAVPPESLNEAIQGLTAMDSTAPIHIHIAEQTAEVDACLQWSGLRPVQWLLNHAPVDRRWCLVHATHMSAKESQDAARSGAVAGICPSTEANLGDGTFDATHWRNSGGLWGVGSDSHACINAAEELMLLEYSQRLVLRQRNVLANAQQACVATTMVLDAVQGGAQACGRPVAGLAAGQIMDAVALDASNPALAGLPTPELMLASHVFASHRSNAIDTVWTGGQPRVLTARHALSQTSRQAFIQARKELLMSA